MLAPEIKTRRAMCFSEMGLAHPADSNLYGKQWACSLWYALCGAFPNAPQSVDLGSLARSIALSVVSKSEGADKLGKTLAGRTASGMIARHVLRCALVALLPDRSMEREWRVPVGAAIGAVVGGRLELVGRCLEASRLTTRQAFFEWPFWPSENDHGDA